MAWCRPGDKPLSELVVMVSLPTYICVTRPHLVKVCAVNLRNPQQRVNFNHLHWNVMHLIWYLRRMVHGLIVIEEWHEFCQTFNSSHTLVGWSWSMVCQHCANYIFILNLTPGFNGLGRANCKTRRETFKFWDLVCHILNVWQYSWVIGFRGWCKIGQLHLWRLKKVNILCKPWNFYPRPVMAFGYCRCLRLSVCVCVCVCVCPSIMSLSAR